MEVLVPFCRNRLTACDVQFIDQVLSQGDTSSSALQELLGDDQSRDLVLDNEALYESLITISEVLPVSPQLYFYVIVRRLLRDAKIDDRDAADYVASLLTTLANVSRRNRHGLGRNIAYFYISEAMEHIERTPRERRFYVRARVANLSLMVTSLFDAHLRQRVERKAAPSPEVYAQMGISQFERLSHHQLSGLFQLSDTFDLLAKEFRKVRSCLQDMQERVTFIGDLVLPDVA
ncbi:MAG: hypothetical protein MK080_05320 [Opitutales bacterium]|nr:hypothetical protein [Opitutales bacterium]NRA27596.1 hypothetical protein [Opitutales bacterium]